MKNTNHKYFFINHIIIISIFIIIINTQPECHINRLPEIIPLQFGQQATINLEKYIYGTNLTYSVQPNDFHSNMQPQYSCKKIWSHRLGKIIQTQHYQLKQNNKTEIFIAMLGGSSYFNDFYLIYYGINTTTVGSNDHKVDADNVKYSKQQKNEQQQALQQDEVLVLQVPRYKLKNCQRFIITSNGTHGQFLLDCMSPTNILTRLLATVTIPLHQPTPITPQWKFIQSPIYLPQQLIPTLNITSSITIIQPSNSNNKIRYLIRMIMTEYADYIEVWRWIEGSREIIGIYDSQYFIQAGTFANNDIDLRKIQAISNTILVMDLLNGLHALQITKTGKLLYRTTLQMDTFSTFHYDPKQQLLFMSKRGIIEQYQVKIFSSSNVKANRVDRYHLYGYQQANQIVVQNRYLYVSTNMYLHIIHLTNIPSNDQQYDGSYNMYQELYNQMMVPLEVGFIKVNAAQAMVEISQCETHPPFLHLKAPQSTNQFTVNAVSVINGISSKCTLSLKSVPVQADDDKVYLNGYESQNETIFSNRPGRAIMDLQKYAIGKNLQYEITLYNHQIQFEYKIRKVNNQSCQIKRVITDGGNNKNEFLNSNSELQNKAVSNITNTFSVGNWLIIQHPQDRVKEYYKCEKYSQIQCNFIQLYITSAAYTKSAYQLLQEQKSKKQSILEAVLFQQSNQSIIEVLLISQTEKNLTGYQKEESNIKFKQQQNLYMVRSLCRVKFPQGQEYKVGQIKLREDKLYIVLPNLKQIRIYQALLSFQQNQQCHYFGNLNLSSFNSNKNNQQINSKKNNYQNGIYFSPKHIDFDKQQLHQPFIVPSFFTLINRPNLQAISESIQTLFITQFNQLLVVRLTINANTIKRVQLLKHLTLDRNVQANDIELIVTLPDILAIDKTQKTIQQYYISHTYDRIFVRAYDFYKDSNSNDTNIRLIDSNTFAVMTQPDALNNSYAQVYNIDSIVSAFKQFAKFKIDGVFHVMSFNEDQYEFITVKLQQTTTLQLICNSTTLTPSPYVQIQIPKPNTNDEPNKQQFFLSSFTLQDSRRQVVTLQVASDSSDIQKGTEYPYTTYSLRIQQDQQQAHFEIDDLKWFQGNVWTQRYVCNDCKTGRIKFQDKISLKQKIQLQSFNVPNDFYVTKANDFQQQYTFETIEGYLLTKMTQQQQNNTWLNNNNVENQIKNMFEQSIRQQMFYDDDKENVTYTFSQSLILSSNIQNDPKCIKASPDNHDLYFVSMCSDYEFLDQTALIQLRLYSTTGFKPFVIHQYLIQMGDLTEIYNLHLEGSTKSQKQVIIMSQSLNEQQLQQQEGNYDTLFVRFDDNIWIFLIVNGKLQLIYTVDKVDFGVGNHLCWIEVIKNKVKSNINKGDNKLNKTMTQYGVIASMCESGLYHIVFTVDPPQQKLTASLKTQKQPLPSFHLLTQQQIDISAQLQKSKIQLPQHSYFLQTIAKPIQNSTNSFQLHMIVSNFNSFIWKVSLIRDTLIISGMELIGIIRRYNQYTPIQVTSHDDRYFSVLYKSTQNVNVSQFLALYDTQYHVFNEQKQIKEYFMFSVQRTNDSPVYNNKSQVYQIGNNMFVLRENEIKIFSVANVIRMRVNKKMLQVDQNMLVDSNLQNFTRIRQSLTVDQKSNSFQQQTPINKLASSDQYPTLYSQSIVIFVQTPTQVNSVTIKLYSIDFFQLSGWTIALIVIGGLFILVIMYYGLKQLWKYYQKRRKLVRLQTHLLDDVSSSQRDSHDYQQKDVIDQEDNNRPQGRQSQITTQEGVLTKSTLQQYHQFEPQAQPQTQIQKQQQIINDQNQNNHQLQDSKKQ